MAKQKKEGQGEASDMQKLENALIALQKTFSRVTKSTNNLTESNTQAKIIGNIEFEIALNTRMENQDHLALDSSGEIQLRIKGILDTDRRDEDIKTT